MKCFRAYYKNRMSEKNQIIESLTFIQEKTIDTTGAGDTFCGCILHFVLCYGIEHLQNKQLEEMLKFANAAASIVATRKGALKVMPNLKEMQDLVRNRQYSQGNSSLY